MRILKEKGSERLHGTFTLAVVHCCRHELASPLCAAVHTMCLSSRSKYPYEEMFRLRKKFVEEQYSSNTFSNSVVRKYFHYEKRLTMVYHINFLVILILLVMGDIIMCSNENKKYFQSVILVHNSVAHPQMQN